MTTNSIFQGVMHRLSMQRGLVFGLMIILALLSFEVFNYSTTDYALHDLLGNLTFAGIRWSVILAIAFCGIDFAGIARLFTPEKGADEPTEVWYLFGAWLLAATMNAMLTWWGVSLAILNQHNLGNAIVDRSILLRVVPIFIAIMVWLIRVLIISTFSLAGERLFTQSDTRKGFTRSQMPIVTSQSVVGKPGYRPAGSPTYRPLPKPISGSEPTYEPVSLHAQSTNMNVESHRRGKF